MVMEKELRLTVVVVSLWQWRKGRVSKRHQEIKEIDGIERAHEYAQKVVRFAIKKDFDYLVEVCPKFGQRVSYGTNFGIKYQERVF